CYDNFHCTSHCFTPSDWDLFGSDWTAAGGQCLRFQKEPYAQMVRTGGKAFQRCQISIIANSCTLTPVAGLFRLTRSLPPVLRLWRSTLPKNIQRHVCALIAVSCLVIGFAQAQQIRHGLYRGMPVT